MSKRKRKQRRRPPQTDVVPMRVVQRGDMSNEEWRQLLHDLIMGKGLDKKSGNNAGESVTAPAFVGYDS